MYVDPPPPDPHAGTDSLTPGREGSAQATSLLLLLHSRASSGATPRELRELLGLDQSTWQAVIDGLAGRGRVRCTGHGGSARWYLTRFAPGARAE